MFGFEDVEDGERASDASEEDEKGGVDDLTRERKGERTSAGQKGREGTRDASGSRELTRSRTSSFLVLGTSTICLDLFPPFTGFERRDRCSLSLTRIDLSISLA